MNKIILNGTVISIQIPTLKDGRLVANLFVRDSDYPNSPVFKVAFWSDDAKRIVDENVDKGDEITVKGEVSDIVLYQNKKSIELKPCELKLINKIVRRQVYQSDREEALTEEGRQE